MLHTCLSCGKQWNPDQVDWVPDANIPRGEKALCPNCGRDKFDVIRGDK